jgi:hypothetical protein
MSKRKRSRKVETIAPAWSDVEQTFFDTAPPDDPGPPATPQGFDDLLAAEPQRPTTAWVARAATEARRLLDAGLRGQTFWIVLATVLVLLGLSAVVFASHAR